jgi:hypothetical protein
MMMPGPRLDPIFYPGDGTVVLRIRGDDGTETTIELHWEKVLDLGAALIDHALAAKRHLASEPKQGTDAPPAGGRMKDFGPPRQDRRGHCLSLPANSGEFCLG